MVLISFLLIEWFSCSYPSPAFSFSCISLVFIPKSLLSRHFYPDEMIQVSVLRASELGLIFSMRLNGQKDIQSVKSAWPVLHAGVKARVLPLLLENNKGRKTNTPTHTLIKYQQLLNEICCFWYKKDKKLKQLSSMLKFQYEVFSDRYISLSEAEFNKNISSNAAQLHNYSFCYYIFWSYTDYS